MRRLRVAAWVAVVCVAAAYGGFWLSQHWGEPSVDTGALAPELTLTDLNGQPRRLSDFRGKILLVNFWATWCAPCLQEIPLLVKAQAQYGGRGLQIIGPAMDEADAARQLAARMGVNYPVMADYAQVDAAMRALGNDQGALPYSVLIGRNGDVLKSFLGGLRQQDLEGLLRDYF